MCDFYYLAQTNFKLIKIYIIRVSKFIEKKLKNIKKKNIFLNFCFFVFKKFI